MAKVGDTIRILKMEGAPDYSGREGIVQYIDSLGQLHGTWGGLAVIPETDRYTIVNRPTIVKRG